MSKTARLAALTILLVLGACQPELPGYYAAPAPPPLEPYLGPPLAFAPPAARRKRIVRRHYVKRYYHHRAHCHCLPISPPPPVPPPRP